MKKAVLGILAVVAFIEVTIVVYSILKTDPEERSRPLVECKLTPYEFQGQVLTPRPPRRRPQPFAGVTIQINHVDELSPRTCPAALPASPDTTLTTDAEGRYRGTILAYPDQLFTLTIAYPRYKPIQLPPFSATYLLFLEDWIFVMYRAGIFG